MDERYMKVGELARRTGVSVRTLHHYHEIGLLQPALGGGGHGEHRLYGPAEIVRLQRIRSLRELGFSLEEIGATLDEASFEPLRVVELHLGRLDEHLALAGRLRDRLEAVARSLRSMEHPSVEELLQTIELTSEMERFSKYYTPEQREYLARRGQELGQERIRQAQEEWKELFEAYRTAMVADQPDLPSSWGVEPPLAEYMGKASKALAESEPS